MLNICINILISSLILFFSDFTSFSTKVNVLCDIPSLDVNTGCNTLTLRVSELRFDGLCVWLVEADSERVKLLLLNLAFLGWVIYTHAHIHKSASISL